MSSLSPREVLAQLQSWSKQIPSTLTDDRELRGELHTAARQFALRLEEPANAVMRLTIAQAADPAVLKIAFDLGIFPYLAKDGTAKNFEDIKDHIRADPVLLLRILRYLASQGSVLEEGIDKYAISPSCVLLGDQSFIEAGQGSHEIISQVFDALPAFLAETNYTNPTDRKNGPANKAWGIPDEDMYEVIKTKFPEKMTGMGTFLGAFAKESLKPHQIYPVKERLIDGFDSSINEHLWVDIGGGMGLYTLAIQEAYPDVKGSFVIQEHELMVNVAQAKGADQHVKFMAHDYFAEQPIKGARAYYFRNIFHNLPDKESIEVLARTKAAMKPGYSRLLIHDLVIPERGASPWEATQDFLMMMGYSALERAQEQWRSLLKPAGLRVAHIYEKPGTQQIIEVEIAE